MRSLLKRSMERVLSRSRIAHAAGRRARPLVLAYHNIVPNGERRAGDYSLHMPQSAFANQLDLLLELYDVVPLTEVLEPFTGRPRAALTFDDAYAGVFSAGREELERRGMPATVFVAPAYVGGHAFWWDMLSRPDTGVLPEGLRRHALHALGGVQTQVEAWAKQEGVKVQLLPPYARAAEEEDLRRVSERARMEYGVHTWSHPSLLRVFGSDLTAELRRPLEWLRARYAHVIPWLSYPYGHFTNESRLQAQRLGYHGAFCISGGRIAPARRRSVFQLERFNVPAGISDEGFVLRAAGVLRS